MGLSRNTEALTTYEARIFEPFQQRCIRCFWSHLRDLDNKST